MRRTFGTLLLLFSFTGIEAQNPNKTNTAPASPTSTDCGPIGCVTPGDAQATIPVQGGSPVVIRSETGTGSPAATDASGSQRATVPGTPVAAVPPIPAFERFVRSTLGHDLPVFGNSLFAGGGGSFSPTNSAPAPADYVIGTGDQILIRTVGKVDLDVRAVVDRNGQIFVPRVGTLTVAGLRLDHLTEFLRTAISQQFTGFDLSVSLGQLRSIQIFVLGQARVPGVYTISSLSTLVNALFASGGPSSTGTLRDIQLKRDGVVLTHFDVYKLLLGGDKSADVRLLPGDIIYIPLVGPQVAVDGDVSTPAIYEIHPGDTVESALGYAGGLTPVAEITRAVLERVLHHTERTVVELPLDTAGMSRPLEAGDILRVFPISSKIANAVTLRGNVAQPGRYAWRPGMRVSDLIPNREFLLTRAYYNRQNALQVAPGEQAFSTQDDKALNSSSGRDDIGATGTHDTEINWNYAAIERLDPSDLTTRIVSFALGEAIANAASPENKTLEPGDVVLVYSRNDVALPLELQAKFVRIDGQVKAPGIYRVGADETLRDLVMRAGGLVPHAYLYAAELTRASVRAEQEARLQTYVARENQEILSPSNQRTGSTGAPSSDLEMRKAYVAELSKIHPTGRIVLHVSPEAGSVADVPPLPLEDGDHFFVPTLPSMVDVIGEVYNPSALSFTPHTAFDVYLDQSGGATRTADRKREFIIRANGTVLSRQNVARFGHITLNPGDALVVPPKLKQGFSPFELLDFTQLISNFALDAVAIKALQ